MQIREQVSLRDCNTLAVAAQARYCLAVRSLDDLRRVTQFCHERQLQMRVLGGGSNVVLGAYFDGCVLRIEMRGESVVFECGEYVDIRVAAGTCWHDFVLDCHGRGWFGLENLALIPGTVGAAPIQNIGAYGVELSELVQSVSVFDTRSGECLEIDAPNCGFAYRHSRFKQEPHRVLTHVCLRLSKREQPRMDYPALREELRSLAQPTATDVLRAVMAIRRRRLPDPAVLPNAGSFFKNPVIPTARFAALQRRHPALVHWPVDGGVKLAAAWLVDQCGWKGCRDGDVGVHQAQALVLVNYGMASARQILALAARIQASVKERFDVDLEIEPVIYA